MGRKIMSRTNWRTSLLNIVLLALIVVCTSIICSAQVVTYDWEAKGDKPDTAPSILSRTELVRFEIRNVNDILYTYHLKVTLTPIPYDDWKQIVDFYKPGGAGGNKAAFIATCPQIDQAQTLIDTITA